MKRYQPKTFRPAFGFASAAVLTAAHARAVGGRARSASRPAAAATMLAAPLQRARGSPNRRLSPARIDVVVVALGEPRDGDESRRADRSSHFSPAAAFSPR